MTDQTTPFTDPPGGTPPPFKPCPCGKAFERQPLSFTGDVGLAECVCGHWCVRFKPTEDESLTQARAQHAWNNAPRGGQS